MAFFKFTNAVDGDEDPVFVEAPGIDLARSIFSEQIGDMPASMLKIEEVSAPPDGEEVLTA